MRTIKFRAWDKNNKIMRLWKYLLRINYTYQFDLFEDENYIFLQYTGLLDKNGVEVYEGDIIFNEDYVEDAYCCDDLGNSVIEWSDDGGLWFGIKGEIIEVIGNIYENPELIKDNK